MADVLLAPLAPELYHYQRHDRGLPARRITEALTDLAHRVLATRR
jgi:hypothetical protein